jgi:hypothetical protein
MNDKEKQLRKEYALYLIRCRDLAIEPDSFNWWAFLGASKEDLFNPMQANKAFNQDNFANLARCVSEGGRTRLSNPEYLKRAELTKEFKERLKNYSGSSEYASDELFRIKKATDMQKDPAKELTDELQAKINLMIGARAEELAYIPSPMPKKTLMQKILSFFKSDDPYRPLSYNEVQEMRKCERNKK